MTRQRAAIDATLFGARLCGYRVLLVIVGFALGNRLFDILECQKQLVGIELLQRFPKCARLSWRSRWRNRSICESARSRSAIAASRSVNAATTSARSVSMSSGKASIGMTTQNQIRAKL